MAYEQQYLDLCKDILENGEWVYNERTGKRCKTIFDHRFVYEDEVPILTTKQCFPVSAFAEVLGYWRQYTDAQDFADIGSPTWFANANKNKAWLANHNRLGENDCGNIYGATTGDRLEQIYNSLCDGKDDRGLIYNMWNEDYFHAACLRPCAYLHHWNLIGDTLNLKVIQRSVDVPLGLVFNSLSFYIALRVMAKITGLKAGKVVHDLTNVHIYEDQIPALEEQLSRTPLNISPRLEISEWVNCLDDVVLDDAHAREYFTLTGYDHLGKIDFPFSE